MVMGGIEFLQGLVLSTFLQVNLVIHGAAPCSVNVSDDDGAGDTMCDVLHLESSPFEVKDEPGDDKVRPMHGLPTILCVQRNRSFCQFLDLSESIQSIHHHESGDVVFGAYRTMSSVSGRGMRRLRITASRGTPLASRIIRRTFCNISIHLVELVIWSWVG